MPDPILNLRQTFDCVIRKERELRVAVCEQCQDNDPPGCNLLKQDGGLYGWSESNCRYELLGIPGVRRSYLRRIGIDETDERLRW